MTENPGPKADSLGLIGSKNPLAPGPDLTISVVRAAQADCLSRIHGKLFTKSWPEHEFASLLEGAGCLATAAWQDEASDPIGLCVLRTVAGVAEIITFGVVSEARKIGVGKALLSDAMARAVDLGCVRAFLEVAEDNQAAQGLYVGFGFREVGRRAGYYRLAGARKIDALVLSRRLAR